MANWLDNTEMSNIWGEFKSSLSANLQSLSTMISQNSSDISDRITKRQFGLTNAFRYKSNNIFSDSSSNIYKYLYSNYASGSSSYTNNNHKKTITYSGRIFEYDCSTQTVIEINPVTKNVTKYSTKVSNVTISYLWYIGTYVSGNSIYSYLWGSGTKGYGIFRVKHNNSSYASSVTSIYISDVATYPEYYKSGVSPTFSTYASYLKVRLSVLVGNSVCVICNSRTNSSSEYKDYDVYFIWDGTDFNATEATKPRILNLAQNFPTSFYTSVNYHYDRGWNISTNGGITYSDSYKISLSGTTLSAIAVVPEISSYNTSDICSCGFYDNYAVFGYVRSSAPNTLMLVPLNNSSYYEVVPFRESSENSGQYYNRLVFTHFENTHKNYMFMPVFSYINGYNGNGVVLKDLDE